MGLAMYLKAEKCLTNEERGGLLNAYFPASAIGLGMGNLSVAIIAIRWRKANAIHAWFVEHVQYGEDDCGDYGVDQATLTLLYKTIKDVLADNTLAEKLLPTKEGFFFGSPDYNQDYFNTLSETAIQLKILLQPTWDLYYFTYSSSW